MRTYRCDSCNGLGRLYLRNTSGFAYHCHNCSGTGTIVREAEQLDMNQVFAQPAGDGVALGSANYPDPDTIDFWEKSLLEALSKPEEPTKDLNLKVQADTPEEIDRLWELLKQSSQG